MKLITFDMSFRRLASEHERRVVLDVLNSSRFVNCAPAAIHAQLLDEGRYIASVRTRYRLLQGCSAVLERRWLRVRRNRDCAARKQRPVQPRPAPSNINKKKSIDIYAVKN
jgi:hypothetical protein